MSDAYEISDEGGVLAGPFRTPVNPGQGVADSIHDDSVAQKLGFRGGTVAGSIHMEQFPPLLTHVLGPTWWETGSLSLYFTNATLHHEPVRCFARRAPAGATDAQVDVWMDDERGMRVAEGTASVGTPDAPSALRARLAHLRPPGDVRILRELAPDMDMGKSRTRVTDAEQQRRLDVITEPLPAYTGEGPFTGSVVTPAALVQALRRPEGGIEALRDRKGVVGLFGAIELRNLAGPVLVGRDYDSRGTILAVGETPRSEYFWYESTLSEAGRDVASMIMMLRFMKASSPLWQ